jgi:hypothetical protein
MPASVIARPSKSFPNFDFWFENKPSGNPACGSDLMEIIKITSCESVEQGKWFSFKQPFQQLFDN